MRFPKPTHFLLASSGHERRLTLAVTSSPLSAPSPLAPMGEGWTGLSTLTLVFSQMVAWGCEGAVLMWEGSLTPPEGGTGTEILGRNRRVKIVVAFLFRIWARGQGAGSSEWSCGPGWDLGAKPAFLLIAARVGWGSYSRPKLPSRPEQVPPGGTWLWARGLEGPPSPSCVTLPVDRLTPPEVRGESRRHPRRVERWAGLGQATPPRASPHVAGCPG